MGGQADPGDPSPVVGGDEPDDVVPGDERHPGQLAERGADVALQERPAGQDPGYAAVLLAEPVSGQLPAAGSGAVAADGAVRGHLCQEPGEQLVEHLGASGVQDM